MTAGASEGGETRPQPASWQGQGPAAASSKDARKLVPDLFAAIDTGPARFEHIVQARRVRQRNKDHRQQSRELEQLARGNFVASEGAELVGEFYCTVAYGGCALTARGQLLSVLNTYAADLVVLEGSIKQLARDAVNVFAADDKAGQRMEIAQTLYSVMTRVMDAADLVASPNVTASAREEALAAVHAEWSLAQERTASLIQREARFEYAGGVLIGAALTLATFSVLGALAAAFWSNQISAPSLLAASLAGTIGAVVSVGQRMATGELVLDYTASRTQKRILGGMRPLIGGVFATVVQFALLGGLLTMQGPDDTRNTPASFAFFALAGFAAGFSERLATDILERAGAVLAPVAQAGGSAAAPDHAPAQGSPPSSPPPAVDDDGDQGRDGSGPAGGG